MDEHKNVRGAGRLGILAGVLLMSVAAAPGGAATGLSAGATPAARTHTCGFQPIECGATVTGTLTEHDCPAADDSGRFVDAWRLDGEAGTSVTIDLTSDEFDTVLELVDPSLDTAAEDDDGGDGSNSRIEHTLDASGEWLIGVSGYDPSELGEYTLSLACDAPAGLFLLGGRFEATVVWRRPNGASGEGTAIPFTDQAGLFYFFSEDNLEMLVKMIDACSLNGHFWVFYAATTNVEFTLRVFDTEADRLHEYSNFQGTAALPIQDTRAFACP